MAGNGELPEDQGSNRAPTPVSSAAPLPSPSMATAPFHVDISIFTRTPFYCEENIYLLCKKLCTIGVADPTGDDLFVVFISNEEKKVPLWYQNASKRIDGLVLWDYHVICIQGKSQRNRESNAHPLVWDLDSSLPFPYPLDQYFAEAIRPLLYLNSRHSRLFRVVHAPIFLRFFASDRRHMKDSQGNWISLPPKYGPIIAEDGTMNNLNEYIEMHATDIVTNLEDFIDGVYSSKYGVVVSERMLKEFFSQIYR
ncbi:protein N-terminal glutamine amidohydrolase [Phoenix dactylifera]|uniref:Protein N-terminal glutamine amidohydrolase n=1 Tax=Phoenix dactylifera TaxID=42345 RepID=A0A8B7BNB4_PHODC|nr:protein N-terminal glutamine amidohydrolase [Phoenix dactylifera]